MKVVVVKYNSGNTYSVECALKRLGINSLITSSMDEIKSADRVIFPGVGEAKSTMEHLCYHGLDKFIPDLEQPVLGICLGMQLLCSYSEENNTKGMGVFPVKVSRFSASTLTKVPHIGWNSLKYQVPDTAIKKEKSYVYFVHSYFVPLNEYTVATCEYGVEFSAIMKKNNFYATQFHPEKSGIVGENILLEFLNS